MKNKHQNYIKVCGAREHNLKNINIDIPRNQFVVITGLSGSGKSSLAFDTLYAEGQRRYVESLSTYARQFLGMMSKPNVDSIEGLSPAISIEQKTKSKNPRSTVGTVTEIYDYLRLLYARIGKQTCHKCNENITKLSLQQIVDKVLELPLDSKILIIAPIIKKQKGEFKVLINDLLNQGFIRAIIDDKVCSLTDQVKLNKNKKHSIAIIVDRLIVNKNIKDRLTESIEIALQLGKGIVGIDVVGDTQYIYNKNLYCQSCNISYEQLEPRFFSFNSPQGACNKCAGIGSEMKVDPDFVVPDKKKSILSGCLVPYSDVAANDKGLGILIKNLLDENQIPYSLPWHKIPKKIRLIILFGQNLKNSFYSLRNFEGIIKNLERRYTQTKSSYIREWIEKFMAIQACDSCDGARLKKTHLAVYINKLNIFQVCDLSIAETIDFFKNLKLNNKDQEIAKGIIKEIIDRLQFLDNVGLNYLNLNRKSSTLSGGESQRIRLAAQIGLNLVGVLYILDEPSIGLHQRDNQKLINTLQNLKKLGNSVVVIEHDEETMLAADWLIDIGPGAGIHGGKIVAEGTPANISKNKNSITGEYLSKNKNINFSKNRRQGNGKTLILQNACGNNLKNINLHIPLNKFICITGVSGSGKSTLINQTLYPSLIQKYYSSNIKPLANDGIDGLLYLDKVIEVNQSPIGKTPRSNPATYTGLFTDIRELYTKASEAKIRGYKAGRFSFNVKGGRCETCQGMGLVKVEMHFLADMYITCDECDGKRFNRETLEIYYNKKNINDVLEMSIEDAYQFFNNHPTIERKLSTLLKVGLGYIKLGQRATTLSGGESQRIKLAKELSKIYTGRTLYILDEPTTGLHFQDIQLLLDVLHNLVDKGNTVIVIEHNLDVIKTADWVIDLGPEGGDKGGEILVEGTPENIIKNKYSYTAKYLKNML